MVALQATGLGGNPPPPVQSQQYVPVLHGPPKGSDPLIPTLHAASVGGVVVVVVGAGGRWGYGGEYKRR